MRSFLKLLLILGSAVSPVAAQSAVFAAPGLRDYVSEVIEQNAGLRAAGVRVAAARARIAPAGALPDPTFTLGAMAVPVTSFDIDREPMTQFPIMVQQRFPFPGKQRAATAVARADSLVAAAQRRGVEADVAARAVSAYFDLADARTALAVWEGRVALAAQAITVARTRYETGTAPQTDLLRAQLRRAQLEEERRRLDAGVHAASARLNALRAGNGDSVFTPQLGSTTAIPGLRGDVIPSDTVLHRQALAQNPQLRSAAGAVVRADRAASTFAIAGRPDFTIGVQAGARLGGRETFLTALVGMSVPLYAGRKQTPAAQAARLERAATEQIYDDLTTQLIAEIAAAAAHVRALRDRILQTADQILPLAEAASASALQRYRVGALEFSAVLDAQDDLFESQLRLADLIAEYGAAWGELTALLGEEWYQ